MIEVPAGIHENLHPRDKDLPRYKGFQLQELRNIQQARNMMERYWSKGAGYTTFVLVLHSWSLLHRNESGHYFWKDDSQVRLFRSFLADLPKEVRVVTATDLFAELALGGIAPAFEMPIQVAGTESIPLLPLSPQDLEAEDQDAGLTPQDHSGGDRL